MKNTGTSPAVLSNWAKTVLAQALSVKTPTIIISCFLMLARVASVKAELDVKKVFTLAYFRQNCANRLSF